MSDNKIDRTRTPVENARARKESEAGKAGEERGPDPTEEEIAIELPIEEGDFNAQPG